MKLFGCWRRALHIAAGTLPLLVCLYFNIVLLLAITALPRSIMTLIGIFYISFRLLIGNYLFFKKKGTEKESPSLMGEMLGWRQKRIIQALVNYSNNWSIGTKWYDYCWKKQASTSSSLNVKDFQNANVSSKVFFLIAVLNYKVWLVRAQKSALFNQFWTATCRQLQPFLLWFSQWTVAMPLSQKHLIVWRWWVPGFSLPYFNWLSSRKLPRTRNDFWRKIF